MSEHKYRLKYDLRVEPGSWTKEQLNETDSGGTDGMLLVSVLLPEDGGISFQAMSWDGSKPANADGTPAPLSSLDVFKIWTLLAGHLEHAPDLSESKRSICRAYMKIFRESLAAAKAAEAPVEEGTPS